jgi:cytoskeletal protein CcmA (bactofilin family)
MMSVFKNKGFDSIIGKGIEVYGGLNISKGQTLIIDGNCYMTHVRQTSLTDEAGRSDFTKLVVNGILYPQIALTSDQKTELNVEVDNVTITGTVCCNQLVVPGTLAIKKGANVSAKVIYYRNLIMEPGAAVHAELRHIDHYVDQDKVNQSDKEVAAVNALGQPE